MPNAGSLKERIAFDAPVMSRDEYGGTVIGWEERTSCRAGLQYRNGGEQVMADRLSGTQTAVITVRRSSATAIITPQWRARDVRSGTIYNIREVRLPPDDPSVVEIMAQSGVAV
ncbi:phage head closure protein [Consotaella salsifontis]|uniref:Phage head-tail adaptor, putative, SPP1 family n=1 Tax=Consotaella salsifontis TaxID=1365950 RepID=A0A1T4SSC2_9HYPH|nr:phage head closure protein [Consotaella salsifontis]SKA31032.1 phage head-tail adaptor, putative, SPP1 family [Consotaella salsifontis]